MRPRKGKGLNLFALAPYVFVWEGLLMVVELRTPVSSLSDKKRRLSGLKMGSAERAAMEDRATALGINRSAYWRGCLALENALAGEDIVELGLDVPPAFRREHRKAFDGARKGRLSPEVEWAMLAVEIIFERAPQTVRDKIMELLENLAGKPWFRGPSSPRIGPPKLKR